MGMLTAVEMWTKRDHDAEWNTWKGWLANIEAKVKPLPSVTTEYLMPEDLSNHSPRLRIKWDGNTLKITGTELAKTLDAGTPRIQFDECERNSSRPDGEFAHHHAVHDDAGRRQDRGGRNLRHALASAKVLLARNSAGTTGECRRNLEGTNEIPVRRRRAAVSVGAAGRRGNRGAPRGIYNGNLSGKVHAQQMSFRSVMPVGGNEIHYSFSGTASGNSMSGTVALGEYGQAAMVGHAGDVTVSDTG